MNRTAQTLTCVAAIAGAHGVHGNVKIKSFTDDPLAFADYGPLMTKDGETLLTPVKARSVGKFFSLSVKEKLSREAIEAMKSTKLYVSREALPEPDEDEFYYSDLIGLKAVTLEKETAGNIIAVHDFGAGDMLEIKPNTGPTFYHPFTRIGVPKIDLEAGVVTIFIEDTDEVPRSETD